MMHSGMRAWWVTMVGGLGSGHFGAGTSPWVGRKLGRAHAAQCLQCDSKLHQHRRRGVDAAGSLHPPLPAPHQGGCRPPPCPPPSRGQRAPCGQGSSVYSARCALSGALCWVRSIRCAPSGALCLVRSVRCALPGALCWVRSVRCALLLPGPRPSQGLSRGSSYLFLAGESWSKLAGAAAKTPQQERATLSLAHLLPAAALWHTQLSRWPAPTAHACQPTMACAAIHTDTHTHNHTHTHTHPHTHTHTLTHKLTHTHAPTLQPTHLARSGGEGAPSSTAHADATPSWHARSHGTAAAASPAAAGAAPPGAASWGGGAAAAFAHAWRRPPPVSAHLHARCQGAGLRLQG